MLLARFLFIWWFAVISPNGEKAIYFEYVQERGCNILQKRYAKVHMNVTKCTWKESKSHIKKA